MEVQATATNDGMVLRVPDTESEAPECRADHLRPRAARVDRHRRGRRVGPVRLPVPGERGAGPAAAPARPEVTLAAVAAADAIGPAADRRRPVSGVPDRAGDDAGVPDRRLRPRRAARGAAPDRLPDHPDWSRSRPPSRRRSPSRCCSATSAPSSTRATCRWRRRGPRPCRWTPRLLAELLGKDGLQAAARCRGDREHRGGPAGSERGAAAPRVRAAVRPAPHGGPVHPARAGGPQCARPRRWSRTLQQLVDGPAAWSRCGSPARR